MNDAFTETDAVRNIDKNKRYERYINVRKRTEAICTPLRTEDYPIQPVKDVSPPKWHLAHTTWFFETFILKTFLSGYKEFDPTFGYHFNSYYETVGERVNRANRGLMSRPGTDSIYKYRSYVDAHIEKLLVSGIPDKASEILELGLQHEMQHQELLLTDIKYILGHQPFFPTYDSHIDWDRPTAKKGEWITIDEGVYSIGYESGKGFHFDNEKGSHKRYIHQYQIFSQPVKFGEYIEFIEDGGYKTFKYWHADAWDFINSNEIKGPLYLHKIEGEWMRYTYSGLKKVNPDEILMHVSYYEAAAYANWKGMRLPTEFEWEVAADQFNWGHCWEWTNSAYLPYPFFKVAEGALGEYNGKFMINQMVLRGASVATSPGHSRKTYRNFFHPHLQWQFAGFRLVKEL